MVEEQAESIYIKLGQDVPMAFRDGMVNAMTLALQKTDDFGDKMKQIGISFLQMIQQAFLQSAASRVVGAVGGSFGIEGADGGRVYGGSGVRDDVPAVLMGGEYVMRKSSVQKYGSNFMDQLNQGMLPGYAKGGAVGLNLRAPMADEREEVIDKNKHGNITRYKTTKKGRGIDSHLSGFARSNDRKIQEYFGDQEKQFNEDLRTKEQEKTRRENEAEYKTQQRKAWQGALLGIAAGAVVSWGMKKYQDSDFAKKRRIKKTQKRFDKTYEKTGRFKQSSGRGLSDRSPAEEVGLRRDIKYFKNKGWSANQMSSYLTDLDMPHSVYGARNGSYDVRLGYAKGGPVRGFEKTSNYLGGVGGMGSLWDGKGITEDVVREMTAPFQKAGANAKLQGGERVVNRGAAAAIGPQALSQINSGSYIGGASRGASSNVSNSNVNNDVNITINVEKGGGVTESSSGIGDPKEFGTRVKAAVMEVIQREKRVGGSLR
jgi:hypothetical protein